MSNLGKQPKNSGMIVRVALTHDLNHPHYQIITLLLDNAPLLLSSKDKIILAKNLYSLINYLFMDSSLYIYFILMYPKFDRRMDRTKFYFNQNGKIREVHVSSCLRDVAEVYPSKSCMYIKLPEFNQINRSMRKNDKS